MQIEVLIPITLLCPIQPAEGYLPGHVMDEPLQELYVDVPEGIHSGTMCDTLIGLAEHSTLGPAH